MPTGADPRPLPRTEEDLVRCIACRTVYELGASSDADPACPHCGSLSWVAVSVAPDPSER